MVSTRRILLALTCSAAALLALPAVASADVYCVDSVDMPDSSGCDHTTYTAEGGLQNALNDAEAHAGADTVRIAPLTYETNPANPDGFQYNQPGDAITVAGTGTGAVIQLNAPASPPGSPISYIGLEVQTGNAPVTISNLKVTMTEPPDAPDNVNQSYLGIRVDDPASLDHLTVDGPAGVGIAGIGITTPGGTITDSTIDLSGLATGLAIASASSSDETVQGANLTAEVPVAYSNPGTGSLLVRRSTLAPGPPGAVGAYVQLGTATIRDTLIDLGGTNAGGIFVGNNNVSPQTAQATLDGVTIAHGGLTSHGVSVDAGALGGTGDVFTANVRNTIIDPSVDTALERRDDAGAIAQIDLAYSNYDPTSVFQTNDRNNNTTPPFGNGTITTTNSTNLTPGFVSPTDFHLAPGSPLIDLGDPAAPDPSRQDLDGDPRAIDATVDCAGARRDIGADELAPATPVGLKDCIPPETTIGSHPKAKTKGRRGTFTFSSSEAGSSFLCSYDGKPYAACGSSFTTPKLKPGRHRFDVISTDSAGNRDQSPATFLWKVTKRKHR